MTYPLIFNINSSFPAAGDTYAFVWNLWHTKQTIFQGTSPFFSNYIFYPNGVSLAFHDLTMFNSLLSIPLQLIFNLTTVYNLLFLLSFILTGFGAYLLVFYLTKDRKASFIAGLLLAFFPYHFAHITHLSLLSMEWIPFFVLYFIKTFEEKNIKNSIFSAIFLTLTALSHWYYLIFLILFVIVFIVYNFFHRRSNVLNRKFIKYFILMFLLFGILTSPFVYPMLIDNEFQSTNTLDSSIAHSADLAAFFVPSETHSIFGKYVEYFYNSINSYDGKLYGTMEESTVFIGYLTLILVFYALTRKNKKIRFWLLCTFIFFILSLGPALHFNGLIKIPVEGLGLDKIIQKIEPNINKDALEMLKHNIGIPLPYIIFNFIPFFNIIRNPSRFVVMLMLPLAVIVGFACSDIFNKIKHKKIFNRYSLENILFLIFCLIFIFEFISIPLLTSSADIPSFYSIIAKDKEDYAIIEIPLCYDTLSAYTPEIRLFEYYQTAHNKKLLCGSISRYPENSFDFIRENPFIYSLSHPEITYTNITVPIDFLKQNKFKYVIIHKNYLNEDELLNLNNLLRNSLQLQYQDNEMIVYRVY